MPKKRDDTGRYTQVATDEDILDQLGQRGPAATAEVAEWFGYERPTAYRRLRDLEGAGEVESRQVGNSLLWQRVDE